MPNLQPSDGVFYMDYDHRIDRNEIFALASTFLPPAAARDVRVCKDKVPQFYSYTYR
jgi:hypothetical protein